MSFHDTLSDADIHVIHAFTFADAAARNAAVVVTADIGKVCKQSDNDTYYVLTDTTPTWSQMNVAVTDTYLGLTDTPGSFTGEAGKVVEVNAAETALQFGQKLRIIDNAQFVDLLLTGNLIVQGTTVTLDAITLQIEDKNIEIGKIAVPSDASADGGGITLKGTTDKTFIWVNATQSWTLNQRLELSERIKITGGGPALDKVLTSDADGLAQWTLPQGGGWTDTGGLIILTNVNDKVSIGGASDSKFHVADGGFAGTVTALVGTIGTFESPGDGYITILTPNANVRGILFGSPSSNIAGSFLYNKSATPNGYQWRVNGDQLAMVLSKDLALGIGVATEPDASSILELKSTTKGLLSPRMSTGQIDAIASPATGLEAYDTAVNKKKIFTGTEFKTFLTEDIGHIVVQDSFASSNVRYFGELGLPGIQTGWTETGTGVISIEVDDNVFGVTKDTVKHFSTTGNSTKSESPISGANWDDILAFGASFSGITRVTEDISTNSIFAGVGFSAANDPRATSIESRAGMFISVDATHTTIRLDGSTVVVLDGTGGNPLVLKDEWMKWEAVINPTPDAGVNFGVVDLYVNEILIVTGAIIASNNAVSDEVSLANSSSSGQTTFYVDNFGVTIYEESETKTLSTTLMSSDVAQITIPEGRRDYTIILPDGNPRAVGSLIRVVVNNLFGKVTLKNQTPAAPEALFNGLAEITFDVLVKQLVAGINTVNQGNVYIGFKASFETIFAQLSSSVNQEPTVTTPVVITYNTQDDIQGLTHSTTVNPGEITIITPGVYFISPQPQVGKTTGAAKTDFDMFLQINRGSGFVDEDNSNIKLTIKDSDITDVIVSAFTVSVKAGDIVRLMQRISSSSVGMGLKNTDAEVGPPTVPRTPAIIFTMYRIGG